MINKVMGTKSMVVVDHSLKGFEGHHFEYSLASAKALIQQGVAVQVSCHKNFGQKLVEGISFQPDFSVTWVDSTRYEKIRMWAQIVLRFFFGKMVPSFFGRFGSEMAKVLFVRGSEVFVHTLNFTQLAEICEIIPLQSKEARFHIVLRYDPGSDHFWNLKSQLLKLLFRWIKKQKFQMFFYSDTPELCETLTERFGIAVKLLPILFESLTVSENPQTTVRISYLGDARIEKGFQHLPMILSQVLRQVLDVQFLIQLHISKSNAHDPVLQKAADEIRSLASRDPQRVVLLPGALDQKAYRDLLEKSDVILLPYDSIAYRWRSSGILVQGAAAGKVVLVPRATSMETMIHRDPRFTFSSPDEIPGKLVDICKQWPAYHQEALAKATLWQKQHSPETFARQILS